MIDVGMDLFVHSFNVLLMTSCSGPMATAALLADARRRPHAERRRPLRLRRARQLTLE